MPYVPFIIVALVDPINVRVKGELEGLFEALFAVPVILTAVKLVPVKLTLPVPVPVPPEVEITITFVV
jgi:hypothetical protein